MGKGSHTFKMDPGAKLKKKNYLDLGPGGRDVVDLPDNLQGKLILTREWQKKDTMTVGGEEVTRKQINNGDLPSFIKYKPDMDI